MPRSDAIRKLDRLRSRVGTVTDAEIAEEAGVSIGSVRAYRKRHGISSSGARRARSRHALGSQHTKSEESNEKKQKTRGKDRRPRRSKVGACRHLLGRLPDSEIAEKAGVTVEAVRMYRRRHRIELDDTVMEGANSVRRRRSALDPYYHLLGTVPDVEVARLADVTSENVRAFRRRHGIDARWEGARIRLTKTDFRLESKKPRAAEGRARRIGFLVNFEDMEDRVVIAGNFSEAVQLAEAHGSRAVLSIRRLGPVLD